MELDPARGKLVGAADAATVEPGSHDATVDPGDGAATVEPGCGAATVNPAIAAAEIPHENETETA